jgi:hypothetical protein
MAPFEVGVLPGEEHGHSPKRRDCVHRFSSLLVSLIYLEGFTNLEKPQNTIKKSNTSRLSHRRMSASMEEHLSFAGPLCLRVCRIHGSVTLAVARVSAPLGPALMGGLGVTNKDCQVALDSALEGGPRLVPRHAL